MKTKFLFYFLICLFVFSCANYNSAPRQKDNVLKTELQEKTKKMLAGKIGENDIIDTVDVLPEIIGGLPELYKYIYYPEEARTKGIEGTVLLLLTIDKSGKLLNQEIVNSVGYGCDEVVIKAVKKVKFKPGLKRNAPVPCYLSVPVRFSLKN